MEKIIIGFSRPKTMKLKFFAWLIMKAYHTPYSHVYVKIWSVRYSRYLIYQASGLAVNFMGSEIFAEHASVVKEFEIEISDDSKTALMSFAIDKAGTPYGIKQVFGMGFSKMASLFGIKMENPWKDRNHTFVCSELVSFILKEYCGVLIDKDIDDMTPLDVYLAVSELVSTIDNSGSSKNP